MENQGQGPEKPIIPNGGPHWDQKSKGWISKYGSSVILPIVALLILAGGIYLYASQKSQEETLPVFQATEEKTADLANFEEETAPAEEEEEKNIEEIIPAGRQQDNMIIEKAVKGDGVTKLARRALKDYLPNHPQELTNEHKVYIEDYLKDKVGSRPLEIDEEIAFSEDLIKEAIDASMQLDEGQLENLEKYSSLIAWE